MASLDLTGGRLDLRVRLGRDAAFIIPTPSDLSGRQWVGEVQASDGSHIGDLEVEADTEKVSVRFPAALTTVLPPRATYEIVLDGTVTILFGTVERFASVVIS